MEYNPDTCVTAKELRERKFPIPDHIPDVAWIPNNSWVLTGECKVKQNEEDPKLFSISYGELVFTQPFRWYEGRYSVDEKFWEGKRPLLDNDSPLHLLENLPPEKRICPL